MGEFAFGSPAWRFTAAGWGVRDTSLLEKEVESLKSVIEELELVLKMSPDMSPRDQFAMATLQGLMADSSYQGDYEDTANKAYLMADAMIARRGKK